MPSLYLYGLLPEGAPLPDGLTGLENAPVQAHQAEKLQLLYSEHSTEAADEMMPRRRSLIAHQGVLDALMPSVTILPLNFGTRLADEAALRALLAAQGAHFQSLLTQINGKVEASLKLSWKDMTAVYEALQREDEAIAQRKAQLQQQAQPAQADLIAIGQQIEAALQARKASLQSEALEALADTVLESRSLKTLGNEMACNLALLIARDQLAAFEQQLEAFATPRAEAVRVQLISPLPPVNFLPTDALKA